MKLQPVEIQTMTPEIFSVFGQRNALLTAGAEGKVNPMTIGWCQLGRLWSIPVCTVYVRPERYTYSLMEQGDYFTVSVFPEEAGDILRLCGTKSGRDVDKFDGYTTAKRADNGIFYITEGTNAYISAKVVQSVDLGTHTMFIADVVAGEKLSDAPSTTYTYYQKNIKPAPAAPKTGKVTWVCQVCGYVYEGEELPDDFICPLCKHGAIDFKKVVS